MIRRFWRRSPPGISGHSESGLADGGGLVILWLLVRRSLRQHLLSTLVTALSLALAGGLLMSVWVVKRQARATFTGQTGAWDAVLGARGAKLQLVLNAIFHLEASPGNVAFADFQTLSSNRAVALAIPIAVGDNYLGYRIVGTLTNLFTEAEAAPGRGFRLVAGGAGSKTAIAKRWWGSSLPNASG